MNHSGDEEGMGANHKVNSPQKPVTIFPDDDGADWLGKTKLSNQPKMPSKRLLQNFKNLTEFSLTD